MRIFIAIEPSEHVKARIFHELETLQDKNLFKGKFVEKQNLHLTLKFLGDISEEKLEEIQKKLRKINFKKFKCEIGNPGFFESEKFIKVIWIGLISDKLEELQKRIGDELNWESKDEKEFSSHITCARVSSVRDKKRLLEEIKKINFKKLDFEVNNFLLIKSELTQKGPIYKVIERFKSI